MVDYLETIVIMEVYDIKVAIYSNLNEYMEIYMYQRSRSFFDLFPRSQISLISNSFCSEATGQTEVVGPIGSVGCISNWHSGGCRFDPLVRQHFFMDICHEIILSLQLIQIGQLSVTG